MYSYAGLAFLSFSFIFVNFITYQFNRKHMCQRENYTQMTLVGWHYLLTFVNLLTYAGCIVCSIVLLSRYMNKLSNYEDRKIKNLI